MSITLTHDTTTNATYIKVRDTEITLTVEAEGCTLDYDTDGHLVGIEILH